MDEKTVKKIMRLSGKIAYVLEKVVSIRPEFWLAENREGIMEDLVYDLADMAEHGDVKEAYSLMKELSNRQFGAN